MTLFKLLLISGHIFLDALENLDSLTTAEQNLSVVLLAVEVLYMEYGT